MKKAVTLFCTLITMMGCSARQPYETYELIVSAKKMNCMGIRPMECLQVRMPDKQQWSMFYGVIEGFEHQEGVESKLRIREYLLTDYPADSPSKRWVLEKRLEL